MEDGHAGVRADAGTTAGQSAPRRSSGWLIALALLLLTMAVRAPFFFPAVINWDESTYILMGQDLLNGHLPYVELWELKPPLAFAFYAAAIALFGQSIFAIRLAGALAVAATALLVYLVGTRIWNWRAGLLAAVLTIIVNSLMLNGAKVTMLEHIALLPLMAALYLLSTRPPSWRVLVLAGVLTMAATMVRLNLAIVPVVAGLYLLLVPSLRPLGDSLRRVLAFAAGNALVLLATVLPYLVAGQMRPWWVTMVVGPLSFADADAPFIGSLRSQLAYVIDSALPSNFAANPLGPMIALVWVGAALGIVVTAARWNTTPPAQRRGLGWLLVFLLGAQLSILATGELRIHYLMQAVPFLALFAGYFLSWLLDSQALGGILRYVVALGAVVVLIAALVPAVDEYAYLASRARNGQSLTHGSAYAITRYLEAHEAQNEPVYMMVDHIVHWFRDEVPLTAPSAHPSMIDKEDLLEAYFGHGVSIESELARVVAIPPKYIVTGEDAWYLAGHPEAAAMLEATLRADYQLVHRVAQTRYAPARYIFRRLDP